MATTPPTLVERCPDHRLPRGLVLLVCSAQYWTQRRNSAGEWQFAYDWSEGFGRLVSGALSEAAIS